jgi:uncharacterized membrane protein YoaK (UPF0700 family)
MTGIVSSMADNIVLGTHSAVLAGALALLSFIMGAAGSAMLVHFGRQRHMHSEYALPLLVEAVLLLCFGLVGARLTNISGLFVPLTVMLLAFIMGLQNAVISKLSNAEIRTTHITGVVTDIGIELGRLFCRAAGPQASPRRVSAGRQKLILLCSLAASFFAGGILGAIGFHQLGYPATVPLALLLTGLASVPVTDDLRERWRK